MESIKLVEYIPTWQGEGRNAGKRMLLLRFKECNRQCSFCDTSKKMGVVESEIKISDIKHDLKLYNNMMITGGEPTLYMDELKHLISDCEYEHIDIETNGFHLVDLYSWMESNITGHVQSKINISFSPKFSDISDVETNLNIVKRVTNDYETDCNLVIKLVIDGDFARIFIDKLNDTVFSMSNVYLMPLGASFDEIQSSFPEVVSIAKTYNCNISSRLHLVHNFI